MLYLLGKGWTGPAVTTEYVRTTGRNMGEPDGAEFGSGETIEGTIWKDSFAVKDVRGVLKEQHIGELASEWRPVSNRPSDP